MSTRLDKPTPKSSLDNLTLARKEGWQDYVEAPKRARPETLSLKQIRALSDDAAEEYNDRRTDWHANMGPFPTPQLRLLHKQLWTIVGSNLQDGDRPKGAVILEGYPCLGKTMGALTWARDFHQHEISRHGRYTRSGDERWPVCRIGMRGTTSMSDFNSALCEFFAHPGTERAVIRNLAKYALDCVLSCEVRLLIIDDLHFLHWQRNRGIEINNHFKYIANDFPVTLLSIGIGLDQRGVLSEGSFSDSLLDQTPRRSTTLMMRQFDLDDEKGRREWLELLKTIEQRLVLGRKSRGMLTERLPAYLFERSGGYIGSLMELINRGCYLAIHDGAEALTEELLEQVVIDSAAEKGRKELKAAFRGRRITTTVPSSRSPRRRNPTEGKDR